MSISGGRVVTVSGRISIGTKDTPISFSAHSYEDCIAQARRWNVVFSDTTSRVHWLADGASTILHFSKAYLSPGRDPRRGSDEILHQIREAECSLAHGPKWAYETLTLPKLRQIRLDVGNVEPKSKVTNEVNAANQVENKVSSETTTSWNTFQALAQKYYQYLEQMHDRASSSRRCKDIYLTQALQRSQLVGYNFMDILEDERWVDPRYIELSRSARVWMELTTQLDSINILGGDFGVLIEPQLCDESDLRRCGQAAAVLQGHDYLVAPMSVLKNVAKRWTKHTHNSVQLAETMHWHDARDSFARCHCKRKLPSSHCKSLVHALHGKPMRDQLQIRREHPIFDEYGEGAIIFGHEQSVLTKPSLRSPDPSLVAVPSDSGYGSAGISSSTRTLSPSMSVDQGVSEDARSKKPLKQWRERLFWKKKKKEEVDGSATISLNE